MTDKFISALEELASALSAESDMEAAIAEIAAEHGLSATALRNRAERQFGDLLAYGVRHAETARKIAEDARERQLTEQRWKAEYEKLVDRGLTITFKDFVASQRFWEGRENL